MYAIDITLPGWMNIQFSVQSWYTYISTGIPIPIVATAVGIAHHHYGNNN